MYFLKTMFLFFLMWVAVPLAAGPDPIKLDKTTAGEFWGLRSLSFSGPIKDEELRDHDKFFKANQSDFISFSLQGDTYWQRLELINTSSQPIDLFIWDRLASAVAFKVYKNYKFFQENNSQVATKNRIVTITFAPGERAIIHIQRVSPAIQNQSWTFWTNRTALSNAMITVHVNWAILASTCLLSSLFTCILWLTYRERVYPCYLGYLIFYGTFSTVLGGVFPGLEMKHAMAAAAIAMIFTALFSLVFIGREKLPEFLHEVYWVAIAGHFVVFCTSMIYEGFAGKLLVVQAILNSIIIVFSGVWSYIKSPSGSLLAFNFAYSFIMFGVVYQSLSWLGFVPHISDSVMDYSFIVENILMLCALGLKISKTAKEKRHGFDQMKKLLYPHQVTKILDGETLEKTMPVGSSLAAIISLDVISSSKIKDKKFEVNLENFLKDCREMVLEGYCESKLVSRAHMVKEVGDGFFCAVGFPFASIGKNIADEAICLAEEFIDRFDQHVNSDPTQPLVRCAVGIALGEVKAYFSQSGSVRHDMLGQGIILAKRYESSRKSIEATYPSPHAHLIILQEKLKNQAKSFALGFKEIRLSESIYVRDDSSAQFLYLKRVKVCSANPNPSQETEAS